MSHCCWMVFRTRQGPWIYSQVHFLLSHSKEMNSIGRLLSAGKAPAPPVFSKGGGCTQCVTVCAGPQHAGPPDWLLGTITSWNSIAIPDTIWQSPPLFLPRR